LRQRNRAFVAAHRRRPRRATILRETRPDHPASRVVFLRRSDARGRIWLLGATVTLAPPWPHRRVRAERNGCTQTLRCDALRRRDPQHPPLLNSLRFPLR